MTRKSKPKKAVSTDRSLREELEREVAAPADPTGSEPGTSPGKRKENLETLREQRRAEKLANRREQDSSIVNDDTPAGGDGVETGCGGRPKIPESNTPTPRAGQGTETRWRELEVARDRISFLQSNTSDLPAATFLEGAASAASVASRLAREASAELQKTLDSVTATQCHDCARAATEASIRAKKTKALPTALAAALEAIEAASQIETIYLNSVCPTGQNGSSSSTSASADQLQLKRGTDNHDTGRPADPRGVRTGLGANTPLNSHTPGELVGNDKMDTVVSEDWNEDDTTDTHNDTSTQNKNNDEKNDADRNDTNSNIDRKERNTNTNALTNTNVNSNTEPTPETLQAELKRIKEKLDYIDGVEEKDEILIALRMKLHQEKLHIEEKCRRISMAIHQKTPPIQPPPPDSHTTNTNPPNTTPTTPRPSPPSSNPHPVAPTSSAPSSPQPIPPLANPEGAVGLPAEVGMALGKFLKQLIPTFSGFSTDLFARQGLTIHPHCPPSSDPKGLTNLFAFVAPYSLARGGWEQHQYAVLAKILQGSFNYNYLVVAREGFRGTETLTPTQAHHYDSLNYREPNKNRVLRHPDLRATLTLRSRTPLYGVRNGCREAAGEATPITFLIYSRSPLPSQDTPKTLLHQYITLRERTFHTITLKDVTLAQYKDTWVASGPRTHLHKLTQTLKDWRLQHTWTTTPTGDTQLHIIAPQPDESPPIEELLRGWCVTCKVGIWRLSDYKLDTTQRLVAISKPNCKDETLCALAHRVKAVWFVMAGRGRIWMALPPTWEVLAPALLNEGFKVVTATGVWSPDGPSSPPTAVVHNIPSFYNVNEILKTSKCPRTCFVITGKGAEPLCVNLEYYGTDPLPPSFVADVSALDPDIWVQADSNRNIRDEDWEW